MTAPSGTAPPVAPLADAGALGAPDEALLASRRYGVRVSGQRLLLDGSGVVRVMEPLPMFPLPNTRPWFLGLANVRGTLCPVYDLALWQALAIPDAPRMLLVVGEGDAAAGILVDESPRHLLIPSESSPLPVLSDGFASHALAAYALDDAVWTALDWDALFAELKSRAVMTD